jgi:MEMO1 family protein
MTDVFQQKTPKTAYCRDSTYDETMAQPLPRLRMNLDFMPSPVEDRPGLLIRDTYGYSEAVLIIPPELVQCLGCFDGEQTSLDLRQLLVRMTG